MFNRLVVCCWLLIAAIEVHASVPPKIVLLIHGAENVSRLRTMEPIDTASHTNKLLLDALDPYPMDIQAASMSRIERLLLTRDNVCAINRIKTKSRTKTSEFSKPINLYLGKQLYFVTGALQLSLDVFNDNGEVMYLRALFEHMEKTSIGLIQDRSYGELLDRQIAALDRKNVFYRGGRTTLWTMMELMKKRRFDFWLGYPDEVKKATERYSEPVTLTSVPVAGIEKYIVGYMECARSATAKLFLQQVDAALRKLYDGNTFKQAHTNYLDRADLEVFERYYQEVFR